MESQQAEKRLAAIYALGQRLVLSRDLKTITKLVVDAAVEVICLPVCSLWLVDNDQKMLVCWAHTAESEASETSSYPLDTEQNVLVSVVRSGEPIYQPGVSHTPYDLGTNDDACFDLCVPLKVDNRVIGVLAAKSMKTDEFSPTDQQLLEALANAAAIAIENLQLFQEIQRRTQQMAALREVTLATLSTLERDQIFEVMLDQLAKITAYDNAAIWVFTPDGKAKIIATRGPIIHDQSMWNDFDVTDNKLVKEMKQTRQPVVVDDAHTDKRYKRVENRKVFLSWVAAPFFVKDNLVGHLMVGKASTGFYSEDTVQILADFAQTVAVALENARLHEDLSRELDKQKQTEEALRISQERFTLAAQGSNEGLWDWDIENNILYWSPRLKELLGYTDDELDPNLNQFIETILHPDDSESVQKAIDAHLKERKPYYNEQRQRTKSGEYRWFMVRGQAIWNENGTPIRMVGSTTDITERKQAEEALRVSEERFALAARGTEDGIFDWDILNRTLYWSPRLKELLGYADDELEVGFDTFESLLHPDDREPIKAALDAHLRDRTHYDVEQRLRNKSGEYRWYQARAQSLWDKDGKPIRMVGFTTDITERKRAEEALKTAKVRAEAASKAKSEFLANMSHEIRTPLNGIIGMIGMLMDTELDEEQRRYAQIVKYSSDSLLSVINDILDYSKIEAEKLDLEIIDFDLRTMVEDVSTVLALKAYEKGLEISCLIHPQVPALLRGDPARIRQILINLIGNAIKFSHEGDVAVRVILQKETDTHATLRFSVTDTGIGIAQKKMNLLFKSFSQVDASTTRQYGGTGLGLAISKKLSEIMGGKIGVISDEGKGSTFWFTLVLEKQQGTQVVEEIYPEDIQEKRVLVVDDNQTNREVFIEYLKSWGCRFDTAQDAHEAMEKLLRAVEQRDAYPIILIDMQMPNMDGETLGRKIKEDPRLSGTLMIMITSLGRRGDAARAKEIGFAAYLPKPIKRNELFDCLIKTIGESSTQREQKPKANLITRHSLAEEKKHNIRILLAEDNMINQQVALNILKKFGYQADAVSNGKEAVKALESVPYDLVLMDVQMPEMDGIEATKTIRNPHSKILRCDVPIIALTAHAMKEDRDICINAGMNDYVSKPIDPQKLLEKMEALIK